MSTQPQLLPRIYVQQIEACTNSAGSASDHSLLSAWKDVALSSKHIEVLSIEAMSPLPKGAVDVFSKNNLLAATIHTAFYKHYPVILSPDAIWVTIVQGLCNHVNQDPEKWRSKFVSHEGKKDIVVDRPDFVKGSPNNDWEGVFPEFSEKIGEHIGIETKEMIECKFSTTTKLELIVSQIALMDTVKSYFNYIMRCGCGIPWIQLLGTVEDWISIRNRATMLSEFGMEWWLEALIPVLDQFVLAAQGTPDIMFWKSICNLYGASGIRKPINGWIQAFFPYVLPRGAKLERNEYLGAERQTRSIDL